MPRAEIRFRQLVESDRDGVLDIARRTWSGHDHLPRILDDWLRDSSNHPYVAATKERVVSVGNLKVIEDGQTGWMEGLRVLPWYRKRGLGRQMTNHLVEVAQGLGVNRLRLTLATVNAPPVRLAESIGMKRIAEYNAVWMGGLTRLSWDYEGDQTKASDPASFLYSVKTSGIIIPSGALVYHWYAQDATLEAITDISKRFRLWTSHRDSQSTGASVSTRYNEATGPQLCATVYPKDQSALLSQVAFHLTQARNTGVSTIMLLVPRDSAQWLRMIPWLKKPSHSIGLALYEKVLLKSSGP